MSSCKILQYRAQLPDPKWQAVRGGGRGPHIEATRSRHSIRIDGVRGSFFGPKGLANLAGPNTDILQEYS